MLIIEVFNNLLQRVIELHHVKPIRDDDECLILMQALNKYRTLIEKHQVTDECIRSEKELLLI